MSSPTKFFLADLNMVYLALTASERMRFKRRKRALALRAREERILTTFGERIFAVLFTMSGLGTHWQALKVGTT